MKKIKIKTNKSAILLPETLKIVIAVLCILLLIYLATKVLGVVFSRNAELEKARETLDAIAGKAEVLKEGDKGILQYMVIGPSEWVIIGFVETKRLCICPKADSYSEQEKICSSQGTCKTLKLRPYLEHQCRFKLTENYQPLCVEMSIKTAEGLEKLPFGIYISRKYDHYYLTVNNFEKHFQDEFYGDILRNLQTTELTNLLKQYILDSSPTNKGLIISEINKNAIIVESKSKNLEWSLELRSPDGKEIIKIDSIDKIPFYYNSFNQITSEDLSAIQVSETTYNVNFKLGYWKLIQPDQENYWDKLDLDSLFNSQEFSLIFEKYIENKDTQPILEFFNNNQKITQYILDRGWGWGLVYLDGVIIGEDIIKYEGLVNSNDPKNQEIINLKQKELVIKQNSYGLSFQVIMDSTFRE